MCWRVRDAEIVAELETLIENRPSRGFWKCRKLLRRRGKPWNHKRIYRVYKLMNLHLRRKAKQRLLQTGPRTTVCPSAPRHRMVC